ncbi:MAG: UMP kinase [Spirochaetia bacterium]
MKNKVKVISLGGSLVAPQGIDVAFLKKFRTLIMAWLAQDAQRKVILIVGGGAPAREYQQAGRELSPNLGDEMLDWIGIAATRLNAQLVRAVFAEQAPCAVVENPEVAVFDRGCVLVASGWKPGFSSDFDAVILAQKFNAGTVINLSNIEAVYSADPRVDPRAKALSEMCWEQLQAIVGNKWQPGANLPFDPIATAKAAELKLELIVAKGSDLENLAHVLDGKEYRGTTVRS